MANPENLKSLADRTTSEQREIAKAGGKKSGQVRKQKKLLSQMYAEILGEVFGENGENLKELARNIMAREDSVSVALMKELREATEGNKQMLSMDGDKPIVQVKIVKSKKHDDRNT